MCWRSAWYRIAQWRWLLPLHVQPGRGLQCGDAGGVQGACPVALPAGLVLLISRLSAVSAWRAWRGRRGRADRARELSTEKGNRFLRTVRRRSGSRLRQMLLLRRVIPPLRVVGHQLEDLGRHHHVTETATGHLHDLLDCQPAPDTSPAGRRQPGGPPREATPQAGLRPAQTCTPRRTVLPRRQRCRRGDRTCGGFLVGPVQVVKKHQRPAGPAWVLPSEVVYVQTNRVGRTAWPDQGSAGHASANAAHGQPARTPDTGYPSSASPVSGRGRACLPARPDRRNPAALSQLADIDLGLLHQQPVGHTPQLVERHRVGSPFEGAPLPGWYDRRRTRTPTSRSSPSSARRGCGCPILRALLLTWRCLAN